MKKGISFTVLLFFIISLFSPSYQVYADSQQQLEKFKNSTEKVLNAFEGVAQDKIDLLQSSITSIEKDAQLEEKSQEITSYIEEIQEQVNDASSTKEIQSLLLEAKKTVVLKVVAGVTPYEDIDSGIPQEVAKNEEKKQEAEEVLKNSLSQEEKYTLMVTTKYAKEEVLEKLRTFDSTVEVDFLYVHSEENFFQIQVGKDSVLGKELLSDIDDGKVPGSLVGISIVQPELFTLSEFEGEDIVTPWGIKKYKPQDYAASLSQNDNVQVAVIDTGVDYRHADLFQNVLPGYDFVNNDTDPLDDQGHGTHVAGTIAAANNHEGIIGVNSNAKIIPLKICTSSGFCPSYAILQALDYVKEHHIPVVNMSLGGRGDPENHPICSAISAVTLSGSIVVAAAGNSNTDTSTFVPGGCRDSLTVGAVDEALTRAGFSNYGEKVDVSAPGVSIYSTAITGTYKKLSGTSMAAPHIAGLVSLLKQKNPQITTNEVKILFKNNGVDVTTLPEKKMGKFVIPSDVLSSQANQVVQDVPVVTNETRQEIAILDPNIQPLPTGNLEQEPIQVVNLNPNGEVHPASEEEQLIPIQEVIENNPSEPDPIRMDSSGAILPFQTESSQQTIYTPIEDIVFPNSSTGEISPTTHTFTGELIEPTVEPIDTIFSGSTVQAAVVQDVVLEYNGGFSFYIADGLGRAVSISTPLSTSVVSFSGSRYRFYINTYTTEAQFQVTLKDWNGNPTNIFNVTIRPPTYTYTTQMGAIGISSYAGKTFDYYSSYTFSNQGIVNQLYFKNFFAIEPRQPGETVMTVKNNSGGSIQYILKIVVIPMPTPVNCTIVEQQRCEVEIPSILENNAKVGFGETMLVNSPNAYLGYFDNGVRRGIYIEGKMEGTVQVIAKNYYGYLAIINVTITLKPIPQERWCTVKSQLRCDIELLNAARYSYTVSNPNIISIVRGDNYLAVYGQGIGKTDLYIKNRLGVLVATVHYTVWPLSTVTVPYSFTTSANAHYLNISPVLYGHTGVGTLNMKSTLLTMKLKRVSDGVEIPLKNTVFAGTAASTGVSQNWIGSSATGWYANLSTGASATLGNDRLTLSITGNNGYAELRNTSGDYWGVTPDSIPVTPNTQYTLEYNYYVEYVSGDADGGWTVKLYTQESDGVPAGEFQAQGYVKNPNAGGVRYMDVSLSTYTLNLQVGQTGYIDVLSGNLGYSVAKNNSNVNVYASSGGGYQMQVVAVANGTSIVEITDSVGKKAQVQVNIGTQTTTSSSSSSGGGITGSGSTSTGTTTPPTATGLNALGSFQYMDYEYISDIDFAYIYFAVDGLTNGGGIEYKDASGNITTETIPNPGDSKYFAAFQKGAYMSFSPYYYTKTGVKVYYKSKTYVPFEDTISVQDDANTEVQNINIQTTPSEQARIDAVNLKIDTLLNVIKTKNISEKNIVIARQKANTKTMLALNVVGVNSLAYAMAKRTRDGIEQIAREKYGSVSILSYESTPNIEDGYVGGFYFTVDHPSLLNEVGIEYYNSTSASTENMVWKPKALRNEGDGQFSAFILPSTAYTLVRGYIVDLDGIKKYTSITGDFMSSAIPIYDYYGDVSSQSIETQTLGTFIAGSIFIAGLGFTAYDCYNNGIVSTQCGISTILVVPVGRPLSWAGNIIPKSFVLKFYNSSALSIFASSIGKLVDDVAKFGIRYKLIGELKTAGVNFTEAAIKYIRKINGKIYWLEEGTSLSGYKHIFTEPRAGGLTRFQEMVNGGTVNTEDELINLMYDIINNGTKTVRINPITGLEEWMFVKTVGGKNVGVATGSNGYIVTVTYQ